MPGNSHISPVSNDVFDDMAAQWPSAIVARHMIREFTGGLIAPKTMANLDSLGQGPEGRFVANGATAYPVKNFVSWLRRRAK